MCGILCLFLIALWVRSARNRDLLSCGDVTIASTKERVIFYTLPNGGGPWRLEDHPSYAAVATAPIGQPFAFGKVPAGPYVTAPYWFLVLLSMSAGILVMPFRRFSLRTLLLITTLVAITLGFVVLISR
jgi:hypothetical protein